MNLCMIRSLLGFLLDRKVLTWLCQKDSLTSGKESAMLTFLIASKIKKSLYNLYISLVLTNVFLIYFVRK